MSIVASFAVGFIVGIAAIAAYVYASRPVERTYAESDAPDQPYRCVVIEQFSSRVSEQPRYLFSIHKKPFIRSNTDFGSMSGSLYLFGMDSSAVGRIVFTWSGRTVTAAFPDMPQLGKLHGVASDISQDWHWVEVPALVRRRGSTPTTPIGADGASATRSSNAPK